MARVEFSPSEIEDIAMWIAGGGGGYSTAAQVRDALLADADSAELLNGGAAVATQNATANMVGDDSTDNLAAWNSLSGQSDYILIPSGDFLFSGPMDIPGGLTVKGSGANKSGAGDSKTTIKGTSGQVAVIRVSNGNDSVYLSDLSIGGASDVGLLYNDSTEGEVANIRLSGTFTNGFSFTTAFGSTFRNLWANGASISNACFLTGDSFSANTCSNWYTSNLSVPYAFYINGGTGCVFNNLTAQGTNYGLFVESGAAHTFNAFYTENIGVAIVLGITSGGRPYGLTFNSPVLRQPGGTNGLFDERLALVDLVHCMGVTFNSPEFAGCLNSLSDGTVTFSGGGGSGAFAKARIHPDGTVHSVVVLRPGSGYSGAPTVSFPGGNADATGTASLSGDGVASVTVTDGGTGYSVTRTPVAIRIKDCKRVLINAPNVSITENEAFYPLIVRDASAASDAGVMVVGMLTERTSGDTAPHAIMRPVRGGNFVHVIEEYDSSGEPVRFLYTPSEMTT